MLNKNCVILPIYKVDLNIYELKSINKVVDILYKYDFRIVTYNTLNTIKYDEIFRKANVNYQYEFFEKEYFNNIDGYNRLMISREFYERFRNYNYVLIYQLDAYVFRDELGCWAKKNYDYIGAPWFEGYISNSKNFIGVGNGGFSLRKVNTAIKVLKKVNFIRKCYSIYTKFSIDKLISFYRFIYPLHFILGIKRDKTILNRVLDNFSNYNEDVFWGNDVSYFYRKFKIPSPVEAMKFSFEYHPAYLFTLNNNELPFGCHAWEKYEYNSFWSKYIF